MSSAPTIGEEGSASYEETHVHAVYARIAPHFSATRHKPWPLIEQFLQNQPAGAVGVDVGCGNGKYLAVNPSIVLLGSDRSAELIALARDAQCTGKKHADIAVADGLSLPYRKVDFAICIAMLHHFSTRARRVAGVKEVLRCVDSTLR